MPFQRDEFAKKIADRLNVLGSQLKTRTRASFTDANHTLEFVIAKFFNALLGWHLVNLNSERQNFPAADLGDHTRRIAIQVTSNDSTAKIKDTTALAIEHRLSGRFDRLIIFFLLPTKPGLPRGFTQPADGPAIETWDLADLLKRMMSLDVSALTAAWQVLEKEIASAATLHSTLHQLPPKPDGFIGRESDLAELRAQVAKGGAHITGLKGMGGIGKTALALVLAHEWAERFPDAQLFLDGRGTQADPPSARKLMEQVVLAFHPTTKLPDDDAAIPGIYRDTLGGKKVLILLDNARDAAQAKPLIPPTGCALIVTSRHTFLLGRVKPHDVGRLPDDEAAKLLREYLPAITDTEAADIVKLCAGLPLALRLAGAHLALDATDRGGAPNVAAYVQALRSGRLAHLDADAADAGEVTISETLRLSEAQLPEAEREAWRKLGVFTASFDARAAEAIARADEKMLGHFLRRSLLEREGAVRFKLHDLAAEYARTQIPADVLIALHLAHTGHYTVVGIDFDRLYKNGNTVASLALFDREYTQIEAAYTWLAGRRDGAAAQQILALVSAVAFAAPLRFHPRQRIAWLQTQLRAARLIQNRQSEGAALANLGVAQKDSGDIREAISSYEQANIIAIGIADRYLQGNALGNLGNAHLLLGNLPKAFECHMKHGDLAHSIGDGRGEGNALMGAGNAAFSLGQARIAIRLHERALAKFTEIGDRLGEGNALGNIGNDHALLRDTSNATNYFEKALAKFKEIGDQRGQCNMLCNLGNMNAAQGDFRIAVECLEQALLFSRQTGYLNLEASALYGIACVNNSQGNRAKAIARAAAALAIYETIESPHAAQVRATLAEWRGEP